MENSATPITRRPLLLWLSVAAMAAILPLLWLLDRKAGHCADGLCTFLPGVAIVVVNVIVAIVLAVLGLRRGERPRWIVLLHLPVLAVLTWLVGVF